MSTTAKLTRGVDEKPRTSPTVVNCYDFLDRLLPLCGYLDMTEGMYYGDPTTPYEEAQKNQIQWLLDQADCHAGSRILDVGCGNGTLLKEAGERGADAIGITISPPQAARCREQGLRAHLCDYRNVPDRWYGSFDAIVANGSIEHFVQPEDVRRGRASAVYTRMFEIYHRLINPSSRSGRVVTTVIHANDRTPRLNPDELGRGPLAFPLFSPKFHYALLQRGFGGFYPEPGQLIECAAPYFQLVDETDGTYDYHLMSEQLFGSARRSLLAWRTGPRIWQLLLSYFGKHPKHCLEMFICLFVAESWQRQFRGPHPPTTLLRHVWQHRPTRLAAHYDDRRLTLQQGAAK